MPPQCNALAVVAKTAKVNKNKAQADYKQSVEVLNSFALKRVTSNIIKALSVFIIEQINDRLQNDTELKQAYNRYVVIGLKEQLAKEEIIKLQGVPSEEYHAQATVVATLSRALMEATAAFLAIRTQQKSDGCIR